MSGSLSQSLKALESGNQTTRVATGQMCKALHKSADLAEFIAYALCRRSKLRFRNCRRQDWRSLLRFRDGLVPRPLSPFLPPRPGWLEGTALLSLRFHRAVL